MELYPLKNQDGKILMLVNTPFGASPVAAFSDIEDYKRFCNKLVDFAEKESESIGIPSVFADVIRDKFKDEPEESKKEEKPVKHILFFGSDKKTADNVREKGFTGYSSFFKGLRNALIKGDCITEVLFYHSEAPGFFEDPGVEGVAISSEFPNNRIVSQYKISVKSIYANEEMIEELKNGN